MHFNKLELAKSVNDYIIENRRKLHEIPEVGLKLPKTLKHICDELDKLNIPYEVFEDLSSVVAVIKGKVSDKTLAIRADMDALPIKEETGLSFASKNENMHACGHDAHMAIALGAAKIINDIKDELNGNVKLIFQSGEEYPGGAEPLIEKGILEDVDAIIGLHAGNLSEELPKGHLGFKSGALMASMDRFSIKVKGKGGHAAHPENANDCINVACEIVTSLNKIIAREVSPTSPAVLSITKFHGGFNQNILPSTVEIEGTARSTEEDVRKHISKRIGEVAEAIAKGYGCEVEYYYDFKYPALINDEKFTDLALEACGKLFSDRLINLLEKPVMSSDDMAYYLKEVPGTYFFLSNPKEDLDYVPHHNPKFDIDEELMYLGVAVYIQVAIDFLS